MREANTTGKDYKRQTVTSWHLVDNIITSCSNKFIATNKEAILWSTCFNVPPRQINNTNLKVRNGIFDEPHGGKMIAYSVG